MESSSSSTAVLGIGELWASMTKHWILIVALSMVGGLLGWMWTLIGSVTYQAEAHAMVISAPNRDLPSARAGDELAKSKALSYKALASTRPIAEKVHSELGADRDALSLLDSVTVSVPPESAQLRVDARSTSASDAALLANTWIEVLSAQVDDLEGAAPEPSSPGAEEPVALVSLAAAEESSALRSPSTLETILGGLLAGLLLGALAAFVRSASRR